MASGRTAIPFVFAPLCGSARKNIKTPYVGTQLQSKEGIVENTAQERAATEKNRINIWKG